MSPHCCFPRYLDMIEQALAAGEVVLIENLEESVDPVLGPLLGRETIKKGRWGHNGSAGLSSVVITLWGVWLFFLVVASYFSLSGHRSSCPRLSWGPEVGGADLGLHETKACIAWTKALSIMALLLWSILPKRKVYHFPLLGSLANRFCFTRHFKKWCHKWTLLFLKNSWIYIKMLC